MNTARSLCCCRRPPWAAKWVGLVNGPGPDRPQGIASRDARPGSCDKLFSFAAPQRRQTAATLAMGRSVALLFQAGWEGGILLAHGTTATRHRAASKSW